ncbi:MAG: DUF1003 domain-containing protein [Terrimonas sp.]|nr:DUF1003 domain-containing protein [Terrimonas sp.]
MENSQLGSLFANQSEHIKKLHEIVQKAIDEEKLITDNLMNPPREVLTRGQRISDKVARFGGSWAFIILFLVVLFVWIFYNSVAPKGKNFDPYPFILMNLILSCIAAFQAPVIMMSQNRQEEKDRQRAENDYMVNMKAELEVRSLHQKVDLLLEEQIKTLFDIQEKQMELLNEIREKLNT